MIKCHYPYQITIILTFALLISACSGMPWSSKDPIARVTPIPTPTPTPTPMVAARLDAAATNSKVVLAEGSTAKFTVQDPANSSPATDISKAAVTTPASLVDPSPHPAVEFDTKDPMRTLALHFQPLDLIQVQIWGYPELDHTAEVQPNGTITLPLVGEIPAAGFTVEELRLLITERLKPFSRTPSLELRPGDEIIMDVWQHEELRASSVIDPAGLVTFPLAGRIMAANRDLETVRKEVELRLLQFVSDSRVTLIPTYKNRRVLYDPQVSVLAQKLEPRRVAIIGEVGSPGLATIRGSLRIVEALAQGQVLDKTAKMNSIVVIRESDSGPQYRTLRIADYLDGDAPNENIYLQHKDIVIVPKTLITKVGDFVDQFLSRTAPVFTWWLALNQARVAIDSAETVIKINKALDAQLLTISPN